MENVAHHLKHEVFKQTDSSEKECFGRSAFNRYYYAIFLEVKDTLLKANPDWKRKAHAEYPILLEIEIQKILKTGRVKAIKLGDQDTVNLCSRAISSTLSLAKLLKKGYSVRVAADYRHEEIPLEFFGTDSFSLNTTKIEDAGEWLHKAKFHLSSISNAWKAIK